jgi:hypothetical protein
MATLLARWRGAKAHVLEYVGPRAIPLGNNGDQLLGRVFAAALRELRISTVPAARDADLLLVRPGGALLDRFQAPRLLTAKLAVSPDLPLVVFPSSSWFQTTDPARMFAGRRAPVLWISREPRSHRHLQNRWGSTLARSNVTLALDHDLVVSGHAYLQDAFALTRDPGVHGGTLLVARLGAEAGSMERPVRRPASYRRLGVAAFHRLPRRQKIRIRRRLTRRRQLYANAVVLDRAGDHLDPATDLVAMSPWCFDISDPTLATYEEFCDAVANATSVITNRLHVAIPAAILGKPTVLVESGYHKLTGVFEHSLAALDNVTFVRRH